MYQSSRLSTWVHTFWEGVWSNRTRLVSKRNVKNQHVLGGGRQHDSAIFLLPVLSSLCSSTKMTASRGCWTPTAAQKIILKGVGLSHWNATVKFQNEDLLLKDLYYIKSFSDRDKDLIPLSPSAEVSKTPGCNQLCGEQPPPEAEYSTRHDCNLLPLHCWCYTVCSSEHAYVCLCRSYFTSLPSISLFF